MTILSKTLGTTIFSLTLVFGLGVLAASASPADTLQPASTITYNEEVVVNNTLKANSAYIGSTAAGVGGVTFFNGTMINNSVDEDGGSTIPLTLGDDVRIDGEIYRTEVGGDNPLKLADTIRPQTNNTYDLGTSTYNFKNGYFAGTVATSGLTGTGIVTSTNILDGTIAAADLADSAVTTAKIADSAVTSAKIVDGTIATADLVDDSVTPAKINGTGGANLPIAYGSVASDGTITAATSNITVTWQAGGQYYEITIDGENYISQEYVTVVTPISNNYFGMVSHGNGKLDIDFMDDGGTSGQQTGFQFVTYKP